jgi:uncharacterized protein (TIGR02246 family)
MSLLLVPPVFTFPQQEVTMSRAFAPSALLLALLGAACSDSPTPTALASPEMSAAHQAALATNPPGQVGHIEALVSAVEAAWAAKDATAFAAAYAEDVDFIGPLANVISGREALRTQHVFLFGPTGPFRQSTLEVQVRRIEFLTGTIAIVDLNFRLTGFLWLPPGLRETEPGVQRSAVRWVVVKHRGEWLIQAAQMTPVPPLS